MTVFVCVVCVWLCIYREVRICVYRPRPLFVQLQINSLSTSAKTWTNGQKRVSVTR